MVAGERVAAPVLARPAIVTMTARVEGVEPLPARELVRVRLAPLSVEPDASILYASPAKAGAQSG